MYGRGGEGTEVPAYYLTDYVRHVIYLQVLRLSSSVTDIKPWFEK